MKTCRGGKYHRAAGMVLAVLLPVCGCFWKGDYGIALPNDYELARIWSGAYTIANEQRALVVGLTVTKYAVKGSIVTGLVTHKRVEDHSGLMGKEGYFVLDTATGALQDGLSEQEWRETLASRGISPPPVLKEPSRKDAMPREAESG